MNHHDGHEHDGSDEGTKKPGGLGEDGTIPADPGGLGATTTDEQSTFEPEEDEAAAPEVDDAEGTESKSDER